MEKQCNPKVGEITENIGPVQRPEYRPDLVARVYKLHLTELLQDIKERHILSVPVAHFHVIEFQSVVCLEIEVILTGSSVLRFQMQNKIQNFIPS